MSESAIYRNQPQDTDAAAGMTLSGLTHGLHRYLRMYESEETTARRMLRLIDEGQRAFSRSFYTPGHFTGSAWIIDPREELVLLTHHRRLDMWLQLGGHGEGEGDILAIARREAVEESGIPAGDLHLATAELFDIDIHPIPPGRNEPAHSHYDVRFLFTADSRREVIVSDESHDLAWVDLDLLENYTREESMIRMKEKSLQMLDELKRAR